MSVIRCAGTVLLAWLIGSPALAQSASMRERILASPLAELNKAVQVVAAATPNYPPSRGGEIAIDWCMYNLEWGETRDDDFLEHFEHLARQRVNMSKLLLANGYPGNVFGGALVTVTVRYLSEVVRRRKEGLDLRDNQGIKSVVLPFEQELADRMNSYRTQFAPGLAQPNVWRKCGGDYVGYVKLKSAPAGATIRLIREFYFKLCQASDIQPFSDACNKWSVIPSTRDVPGGIYYYLASWPDGRRECDRIEFTGATPDEDNKTITINQSGKGCTR